MEFMVFVYWFVDLVDFWVMMNSFMEGIYYDYFEEFVSGIFCYLIGV